MRATASALPKPVIEADSREDDALGKDGNNLKRQTLYLPFGVHDQLRDIAHAKRISQQEIFRRALDLYFAQEGMPSWDEAKQKGDVR